jgi:hypothetical protein
MAEGGRLRSVDYRAIYEVGGKQVAVIPADDYRVLLDKAEMLDDVAAHDRAKAALASGDDELLPAVIVDAILDGENPVRVWRQHREMPQSQPADAAGSLKRI